MLDFHATSVGGVFALSEDVCYAAVTDNANGPGEWLTQDGGSTYSTTLGGWLNTDVAHDSVGNGIISTIGKTFISSNGEIRVASGKAMSFSQSVETLGDKKFAVTGQHYTDGIAPDSEFVNGPGVTTDAGATWTYFDTGLDGQTYMARYGAFPSDNTWYVSHGSWIDIDPSMKKEKDNKFHRMTNTSNWEINMRAQVHKFENNQVKIQFNKNVKEFEYNFGAISKTEDGGKTWTKLYDSQGKYYMNQISCSTTEICTVAAESSEEAIAFRTEDGGKTWNKVFTAPSSRSDVSLIGCKMLSDDEIWLTGGNFQQGVVGWYFHSTDAGKSWKQTDLDKGYAVDLSFYGTRGYSTAMSEFGSTIAVYK